MENNNLVAYEEFDSLIARHKSLINGLCMRYASGDETCCAELRQDCYISLWHYLPTLREGSSLIHETAWVIWHCRSVFSHMRYRRRTHQLLPFENLDEEMADTMAEPEDDGVHETLETLALHLTPEERDALFLMAEGYSAEELAQELGIKHRSAVQLRHRIIGKLRDNVEKERPTGERKEAL